jgi:hypothetical protein
MFQEVAAIGGLDIQLVYYRRLRPNQYGVNVACLKGVSPFDLADVPVIDGVNHPADQGRGYEIVGHLRFIRLLKNQRPRRGFSFS